MADNGSLDAGRTVPVSTSHAMEPNPPANSEMHTHAVDIPMSNSNAVGATDTAARGRDSRKSWCGFSSGFRKFKHEYLMRKVLAEIISTYILVFTGCGAAIVDKKSDGQVTHLGVSIAFGIVVMVMVYAVGHISGAHMNPAVTVAFAAVRHFPLHIVPAYIGGQVVGATLAGFTLRFLVGNIADVGATLPQGSDFQSFVMEFIITYILMFVVSAVATDTRAIGELAGVAVGSTVGLNAIYAGPISGASMNPARSIGPAIASTNFTAIWVYIFGPVLGALFGAWSYNLIRGSAPTPAELEAINSAKSLRQ